MVGMGNRKSSQHNSRPVLGLTEISTTSWIINLFMLISLCFLSRPSIPASFVGARAQRCIVEVPCGGKATRHFNVKTALSCPSLLLPFPSHPRPPGAEISSPKTATTPRKPSPQYPTPLLPAHHNPSLKKPKPSPSLPTHQDVIPHLPGTDRQSLPVKRPNVTPVTQVFTPNEAYRELLRARSGEPFIVDTDKGSIHVGSNIGLGWDCTVISSLGPVPKNIPAIVQPVAEITDRGREEWRGEEYRGEEYRGEESDIEWDGLGPTAPPRDPPPGRRYAQPRPRLPARPGRSIRDLENFHSGLASTPSAGGRSFAEEGGQGVQRAPRAERAERAERIRQPSQ